MKELTIFLAFVITFNYKTEATQVSGGKNAKRDQFPFFAQFFKAKVENEGFSNDSSLCGASLINPQWILSSASCFPIKSKGAIEPDIMMLFMATNQLFDVAKGVTRAVTHYYVHPKYDVEKNSTGIMKTSYDIGLGKLESAYHMNIHIQMINFPPRTSKQSRCNSGTVVGIGMYKFAPPERFQFQKYADITVINPKELKRNISISKNQFYSQTSLSGKIKYLGDNGGPFLCYIGSTAVIYGVTSWVTNDTYSKTVTAAYEAIDVHMKFILSHVSLIQFYGEETVFPIMDKNDRTGAKSSTCRVTLSVIFYFTFMFML